MKVLLMRAKMIRKKRIIRIQRKRRNGVWVDKRATITAKIEHMNNHLLILELIFYNWRVNKGVEAQNTF